MKKRDFSIVALFVIILFAISCILSYAFFDSKTDIDMAVFVYGRIAAADSSQPVSATDIMPDSTESSAEESPEASAASTENEAAEAPASLEDSVTDDSKNDISNTEVSDIPATETPDVTAGLDISNYDLSTMMTLLYRCCLHRELDEPGLDYWSAQIDSGLTVSDIAGYIMFGEEFMSTTPDNESFAKAVYTVFTGTTPDEATLNSLVEQINYTCSRENLFNTYLTSPEFLDLCNNSGLVPGDPLEEPDGTDEWQRNVRILELCNEERAANGLDKLLLNNDLWQRIAMGRSWEISKYFSHTRSNGSSCFSIYSDIGTFYQNFEAELIAKGKHLSADKVARQWLSSKEHRDVILNPDAKYLATGYYHSDTDNKDYYCQCLTG
ncbi:MAG: DUF4214 domain-containing protein [Lachnospiraceae bacterium]|nr:DUF4214 domain-containing protein [Lachnospiraceae bacterium]